MEDFGAEPNYFGGSNDSIWNGSSLSSSLPPPANGTEKNSWKAVLETTTAVMTTFNLVLLMFGMGSATYLREIWMNLKKPWGSVIGMICQFGVMPAVGFGLARVLNLPIYQALGLLILCCSPGGAFSNFFAYWLDGDIALSLLMTATSSLIAFGGMPLNIWLYSHYWTQNEIVIPYLNILISMTFATVPALLGMYVRHKTRIWATRITKICSVLGWIGAITAGSFMVVIYWESLLTVSFELGIAAAVVPLAGFLLAFSISKIFCLNNSVSRTIGIETGCQNIVIGMNVMLMSFTEPEVRSQMIIFPMFYGLTQMIEVVSFIIFFHCYKFANRHNIKGERVQAVIDDSVLMSVPLPTTLITDTDETNIQTPEPDVVHSTGRGKCSKDECTTSSARGKEGGVPDSNPLPGILLPIRKEKQEQFQRPIQMEVPQGTEEEKKKLLQDRNPTSSCIQLRNQNAKGNELEIKFLNSGPSLSSTFGSEEEVGNKIRGEINKIELRPTTSPSLPESHLRSPPISPGYQFTTFKKDERNN